MFSFVGKISQIITVVFQPPLSDFSKTSLLVLLLLKCLDTWKSKVNQSKISEKFDMKMEIIEIIQLTLFKNPKFVICDLFYIFFFFLI